MLEQLHEHGVRVETGFQLDHQTGAVMAVAQVDRAGNAFELMILHAFGDAFKHLLRAHHVGQFGHHDGLFACGHMFDMRGGASGKRAASGSVCLADAVASDDHAAGRPIRAGHVAHQLLKRGVRVRHQILRGVHDLAEIMRGEVRGHAHGDAGAAVDQQVRDGCWKYGGFFELVVVVWCEVDGVLVDIGVHAERRGGESGFGVTGCRRSVVQRTEIAVTVHERQSHGERLCQSDHGFVDG